MMHLYSALLCIAVHPKHFTIMWWGGGVSLLNHHQCVASIWMMRRLPQDNSASALTTHQLQVERRESHRANSVDIFYKKICTLIWHCKCSPILSNMYWGSALSPYPAIGSWSKITILKVIFSDIREYCHAT